MAYTPVKFMDPSHPDAFLDFQKMTPYSASTKECPWCKGFGGWNLQTNAYGLPPGQADTPENRHRYVHFRASCSHCNGYGYVSAKETCPGHDWVFVRNLGNCHNRYRCSICGVLSDVDSSG